MKKVLIIAVVLVASLSAQNRPEPPGGPPAVDVILCAQRYGQTQAEKLTAAAAFINEGCDHIDFIQIPGRDWWIGYGTQIIDFDRTK
jgi:hypothetical protein